MKKEYEGDQIKNIIKYSNIHEYLECKILDYIDIINERINNFNVTSLNIKEID